MAVRYCCLRFGLAWSDDGGKLGRQEAPSRGPLILLTFGSGDHVSMGHVRPVKSFDLALPGQLQEELEI